jgi:hypothetical protein
MVTFWFVTVNGMQVDGPLSWKAADKRRAVEKVYNPRAVVQLFSVTVCKSQVHLLGGC